MKSRDKRSANKHAETSAVFHAWLFGLLLVCITIIAYHPAWHAGFIWDDDVYVTENPLLTAPHGLERIWLSLDSPSQYFPLTYTTFYLERGLWGLNPAGYHWVNLLLHTANALLVWRVLARLRVPGAWLAAAVFALHPVQVESVAWITERKNVLMGFFFLLALWAWIKFIKDPGKRPWQFYALALVFYALALFAKTTACTLPAALLLVLWLEKTPVNWRRLAQIVPFVAMGLGMGLVTMWWERYHIGTQGDLFVIGPMKRVLIASRALWFYASKLLWPAGLTFSYPRWTISPSDPREYGWLVLTAVLIVVIWGARRWLGRGPEVATMFFAVTLSPVLGFIMLYTFLYSFVADHYQYLACIGLIALAVAGIQNGLGRTGAAKVFLRPLLSVSLLLTLGTLTWKQCGMYVDAETLWQKTVLRNPNSWLAQSDLGIALVQQGRVAESIPHFQKAVEIDPNDRATENNLAWLLATWPEAALRDGRKAVELALQANTLSGGKNPVILHTLAAALAESGRFPEAVEVAQRALQLAEAQFNAELAGHLQSELKLYQAGLPYHLPAETR